MSAILSIVFFVILGYTILGAFMFWFGDIASLFGQFISFLNIPFDFLNSYFFPVYSWVYLAYGGLIFILLYHVLKSVFLNKK